MFGPNTYFKDQVDICYSHRDKCFFDLLRDVRAQFSEVFGLHDYDLLFIPGSGTVGIEALFFSCKRRFRIIGVDGTFKNRWTQMEEGYRKEKNRAKPFELYCRLETSCSETFEKPGCFIDAISAFPYYEIPEDTLGFVTCLNKQLGSYIGISVVCIRKDMWKDFLDESRVSYLNLSRYKSYMAQSQTPSTAPTYIFEHLQKVLNHFNLARFRERIDAVSDLVVDRLGRENILGNPRGPVITVKNGVIPESLARKYDIYGYWAGRPNYQIFTYSDRFENYEGVLNEIHEHLTKQKER